MLNIYYSLFLFCILHLSVVAETTVHPTTARTSEQSIAVISSVKPATDPRYGNILHETICKALLQSKKSIRIFNYSAYDQRVIEALNQKALEGIDIGLVIDKAYLLSPGVLHAQIQVFTRAHGEGHYHHKIFLIDDELLYIGTQNVSGIDSCPNIMVGLTSRKLAEPVLQEWDFYAHGTPRTLYEAEEVIAGQRIKLFMMPHVSSPMAMPKEQQANTNAMNMFLSELSKAQKKIVASIVVWTLKDFAREMVKAKLERKVDVVCHGANVDPAVRQILQLAGIPLFTHASMHHKTLFIDDEVLINGSANFSMSAFSRGDESVTFMDRVTPEQGGVIYESIQALR